FWDFQQRPSRYAVSELAKMKERLENRGLNVLLIHSTEMDAKAKEWIQKKQTAFNRGCMPDQADVIRKKWGVQSLPWLILTDAEHKVVAEGFSVKELEDKLD
ncbi:MAG: TlpA family protein disulfide reductase, partial [Planctomycetota bacterium]